MLVPESSVLSLAAERARIDGTGGPAVVTAAHGSCSLRGGVSLGPPLVMVAVQKSSTTWPVLASAATVGVSILAEDHHELTRQLAAKDKSQRFSGVAVRTLDSGAIFIDGASLSFECTVHSVFPAGDHEIVLLEVKAFRYDEDVAPLIFHGSAFKKLARDF